MPPKKWGWVISIAALLCCGCTTTFEHTFEGRAINLAGDGGSSEGKQNIPLYRSERTDSGHLLTLRLAPKTAFVLAVPANQAEAPRAWLNYAEPSFAPAPSAQQLGVTNIIPLAGKLKLRWRTPENFRLQVDLQSSPPNPAGLKGEFLARTKWSFKPHLAILMMAYDMGLYRPKSASPKD